MTCPICHKPVAEQDPHYPFCSQRCRIIDLGNWASEAYVVSTPADSQQQAREENGKERPESTRSETSLGPAA